MDDACFLVLYGTRRYIWLTENAGHENAGHEFAIHDKHRMKIYYISAVKCAFLLNFKSFVCTASVLTWKT